MAEPWKNTVFITENRIAFDKMVTYSFLSDRFQHMDTLPQNWTMTWVKYIV